jgi:hypothetical protein
LGELIDNEKQSTPDPISDPPLEVADILDLLKGSLSPQAQQLDFVIGDPLDELYRQAVEAATEWQWPIPSRAEFEKQYKEETEKLRRHDAM